MKRVAVYLNIDPECGGSFQYAWETLRALSLYDRNAIQVRVWHTNTLWTPLLLELGFDEVLLTRPGGLARIRNGLIVRLGRILPVCLARHIFARIYPQADIAAWLPDVIICPQMVSLFVPRCAKQLCAIHDLMHIYEPGFPEVGEARERAARERLFLAMAHNASDILVDSPLGKEHVLENYAVAPEQVHVLPFVPSQELLAAEPVRPATPLPGKFIYYPAQLWLHKNHRRLLEAIATILSEFPDIHCIFTGATKYEGFREVQKTIERLSLEKHVSILGYVPTREASWLYRNARCLVMPTFFGPTNIPPLEAMALGCPVAVSDIYAMRWQCGDAAAYFKPDSVESIAETLRAMWADDDFCAQLRHNGLERASGWTSNDFASTFCMILARLCNE